MYIARGMNNAGLINQLKGHNIIQSQEVYHAMLATDRGYYMKTPEDAYNDRPSSIGWGATISAPHMHAHCLELFLPRLKNAKRVLDVGSGSGYLCACMARLVPENAKVYGIDVIPELVEFSKKNIMNDDPNLLRSGKISIQVGDGWKGEPEAAPFDVIHVGAAARKIPQDLVDQLSIGGQMVIPVGTDEQYLVSVKKHADGQITQETLMGVRYVPLVERR